MILFLTGSYFSNWVEIFKGQVNLCQRGRVSLGPITINIRPTNMSEQICNDYLCGIVKMKMDFTVRGLEFKSR